MTLETRSPAALRFGTLEADLRTGELRKQGVKIRIQELPFQILSILLRRPGQLVSREELRTQIWPADTFVDFDNSLNTSINKLREALGDSADSPHFIETLPRRGYRFIAPVTGVDGSRETLVGTGIGAASTRPRWKTRILVLVALLTLAALAVGAFDWRSRQARRLTEKDTIVLADFANTTGDPVFDDTLKQGLRVQLEQSPFLDILPDSKVSEELQMMGRLKDEHLTLDLAREVCQRMGSKAVLAGSISRVGAHYAIGMNALNCQNGDNLSSAQVEADSQEHVLKMLGESATKMRQNLGESLKSIQRFDASLEQVTTPSLQALRAYSLGLKTGDAKGNMAAIPFLQRAVELDPEFAMAYARLGALYAGNDAPLSSENVRKAYELRERVTERERLYIEAHYYRDVTGEQDKAASVWEVMQQTYPREVEPHSNLAGFYGRIGNYEKALEESHEALRLDPNDQDSYRTIAYFSMCLNRLDEAEAAFQQAKQRKLEGEDLLGGRYTLAFLKGDAEGMAQVAASAAAVGKPLLVLQGFKEAYYGRLRMARELLRQAVESAKQNDTVEGAASLQAARGLIEALPGRSATCAGRRGRRTAAASEPRRPDSGVVGSGSGRRYQARRETDRRTKYELSSGYRGAAPVGAHDSCGIGHDPQEPG